VIEAGSAVPYLHGGAEASFGMGEVHGDHGRTVGSMRTGPWSTDADGRPCPGALGVLIDDVLGYAVVSARPPGHWAVSTEIHADFGQELPGPGAHLRAESSAIALGPRGGLASGVVRAEGGLIATATERLQFVPGEPGGLSETGAAEPLPAAADADPGSLPDLLGAVRAGTADAAVLRFTPTAHLANPVGNLHGGVLFAAVELAGRWALEPGPPLVTSSLHLAFLRPLRLHAEVRLEASVAHRGRTLGVAHVVATDPGGKVCALATVTGRGEGAAAPGQDPGSAAASRRRIAAASSAIAGTNSATSTRSWIADAT
jgi:uncharacterized protein (TIGR00369 family)